MDSGTNSGSIDVLEGVITDYFDKGKSDLIGRWTGFEEYLNARLDAGLDPYSKYTASKIGPEIIAYDRGRTQFTGVNFASQDYLNLSTHPAVIQAATKAANTYGVHSAGSAALMGLTELTMELERTVAKFFHVADATVFPTGWGAGFGLIKTLVKPWDHVIIDVLAHACLQEGADSATANVHRFPHCSNEAVERRLSRIRQGDRNAGILVVTETVFSMDSDVPQLRDLQQMCRKFDATLMVDVAHDAGAIGPRGRGYLETQGVLGEIDIVMGSFSKTFASNGGFVATNRPELKPALRYACGPLTFTNSMSPVQAATVLECFRIVDSAEGQQRRTRLMSNITYMREQMAEAGFALLGQNSAIIPVIVGTNGTSRMMTSYALRHGAIVNLVEYPAVSKNGCRWRVQVMHDHTTDQIDRFVETAKSARRVVAAAHNLIPPSELHEDAFEPKRRTSSS
ncbi:aminotransferase class I/II-fold pyridoxal phosphate-dependent enzyme [Rhizobium terrae]|uniref:aminotransferase class I/II-fold pyridoxal phosphate-dependent enzyme n=1 Tax=Rhizobium terrae TaxID=2171756 RepID=UPI000E3E8F15|nr:aminotransferase class I/II-fold pyridoxal phosphate-dependent enzyme [Rhizobium terrae]